VGIDLERQQPAKEAEIGAQFIERNECEIADEAVLSRLIVAPMSIAFCAARSRAISRSARSAQNHSKCRIEASKKRR
jgi:hypothetical protein